MSDWNTFCTNFKTVSGADIDNCTSASIKDTAGFYGIFPQVAKDKTDSADPTKLEGAMRDITDRMKEFCCTLNNKQTLINSLRKAREDNQVAKARVASQRNPAGQLSDLGTTFPFGRPLRPDSVPLLLASTLVLFIMSLGVLLNLNSIEIAYTAPGGFTFFSSLYDSYMNTSNTVMALIIAGSAATSAGLFYAIYKYHPDWIH